MTWTKTQPTKADWYWWRADSGDKPLAIKAELDCLGRLIFKYHDGLSYPLNQFGEWWSEPIPNPSEPEPAKASPGPWRTNSKAAGIILDVNGNIIGMMGPLSMDSVDAANARLAAASWEFREWMRKAIALLSRQGHIILTEQAEMLLAKAEGRQ